MGKKEYLVFLALVFELVGLVIAFVYLGHYIEQKYGFKGFGVAIGALLALIIWVIHLTKAFKITDKKDSN